MGAAVSRRQEHAARSRSDGGVAATRSINPIRGARRNIDGDQHQTTVQPRSCDGGEGRAPIEGLIQSRAPAQTAGAGCARRFRSEDDSARPHRASDVDDVRRCSSERHEPPATSPVGRACKPFVSSGEDGALVEHRDGRVLARPVANCGFTYPLPMGTPVPRRQQPKGRFDDQPVRVGGRRHDLTCRRKAAVRQRGRNHPEQSESDCARAGLRDARGCPAPARAHPQFFVAGISTYRPFDGTPSAPTKYMK
jgi:hypothetical protein